jgi:hypothetical protein
MYIEVRVQYKMYLEVRGAERYRAYAKMSITAGLLVRVLRHYYGEG